MTEDERRQGCRGRADEKEDEAVVGGADVERKSSLKQYRDEGHSGWRRGKRGGGRGG